MSAFAYFETWVYPCCRSNNAGKARLGTGGLIIFLFAIIIFQLADRDNRNGWVWGGANLAGSMLSTTVTGLGGIGVYIVFIATLAVMIYLKPIKRKW